MIYLFNQQVRIPQLVITVFSIQSGGFVLKNVYSDDYRTDDRDSELMNIILQFYTNFENKQ